MTTLRKVLPLLLALVALGTFSHQAAYAQNNPDCSFTTTFTTDATGQTVSNLSGQTPCVNWRVTFSVTGTLSSSVTFQTSPDGTSWTSVPNTVCAPGSVNCMIQGVNPTVGTQGMMYLSVYGAYVRVITSGSSGTGTGTVRAYGAKGATAHAPPPASITFQTTDPTGACTVGTPDVQNTVTGVLWVCVGGVWVGTNGGVYVPYIGATGNVDLGSHDILTGTGNAGFGVDLRTGNVLPLTKEVVWGGNLVVGDPSVLGSESLTNGALTSGTSWTQTGDFALTSNAAVYTDSTHTGTIVQANGVLAVKIVDNRWYKLVYTISAVTPGVALSLPAAICDTIFNCTFDSTAGVAKVFYWKSATGANALAFTITGTSSAGGLTLDDLSLKEVQGGNVVAYGLFTGGGTTGIKVKSNGQAIFTMGTASLPSISFGDGLTGFYSTGPGNTTVTYSGVAIASFTNGVGLTALGYGILNATAARAGGLAMTTGIVDSGTIPTITGCGTISAAAGGATAGTFTTNTTGTCTAVIPLPTAPNGWTCYVQDITKHVATNILIQSASATNSCTVTGVTAASDVLTFMAIGW